ncbi:DUF7255 family protein [Paeniglutamicibacter sulfureus]|uniref:Uncharacterized protein n=1 Tax=Paeniglutamicibacter sulfureus TaxID=43666 RepID=A0ABU2BJX8_9MICC|nr:hypothetical protein [Paeniglutamicibacter sulfureus]MDR7358920.1 hypothetical protein [Paeniglutamicibacter sulfureus]
MARGDTENAFKAAALADGIALTSNYRFPWINQKGHFGLPDHAHSAAGPLHGILLALGGDAAAYAASSAKALFGDLLHEPTGTIIEVDEHQHFTSHRLTALNHYPSGAPVGFDLTEYRELCRLTSGWADKFHATKVAKGFPGLAGRARQRAYYDSLRDLSAPAMGRPPVIRVQAIDDDGTQAYSAARVRIREALRL